MIKCHNFLQSYHVDAEIMHSLKRILQAAFVVTLLAYSSLLIYQRNTVIGDYDLQDLDSEQQVIISKRQSFIFENPKSSAMDERDVVFGDIDQQQSHLMTITTPPAVTTTLNDIFISVKTTKNYHNSRLPAILKTWFQLARNQTWFFTDTDEEKYQKLTDGRMINTNCSASHNRKALCCKMSVEFDTFLEQDKKWFCHVDDDNYVNVPRLVKMLADYNPQRDWYLGKPSIKAPLQILGREQNKKKGKISFWFATGGAGFCISRALARKMESVASGGKFMGIGEKIRLPDDVTMGYIIEYLLGKPLTVIEEFHSHLEPMKFLQQDAFHKQITFSYSNLGKEEDNILKIDGFDVKIDPTRFYSIHCFLFPHLEMCPR